MITPQNLIIWHFKNQNPVTMYAPLTLSDLLEYIKLFF